MKYILFGAGAMGINISDYLGKDNVDYFVDNNKNGEFINNIPVKSACYLNQDTELEKKIVIIATSPKYYKEIAVQLEEEKIYNFILWGEFIAYLKGYSREYREQTLFINNRKYDFVLDTVKDIYNIHGKLKQSADSQVEFYLVDAFEIDHFLPIYNELLKRGIKACFVAENKAINSVGDYFNYDKAIQSLKEKNLPYTDLLNPYAKVALTTQFGENLREYKFAKRINVSYGASFVKKIAFLFEKEVATKFDYLFILGQFEKNMISKHVGSENVIITCFFRNKAFLENPPSKEDVKKELKINTEKPILVYFPTYDEYGSIKDYSEEIGNLRKDFFVVSKPHHCTMRPENKEELDMLYKYSDLVLDGGYSFANSSLLADIAVIDAKSGAVMDVPYLNRDVKTVIIMQNMTLDNFYLKLDDFYNVVFKQEELVEAVNEEFKNFKKNEKRNQLLDQFYIKDFKKGFEDAISTIENILKSFNF